MTKSNVKRSQKIDTASPVTPPTKSPRRRTTPKIPPAAPMAAPASPPVKLTKRDQLAALLVRDQGATIDQMIAVTDWLPHTTRAALTGLRKAGYAIDSDKVDGVRTYRAVAPK